jgi:hypothetical protein
VARFTGVQVLNAGTGDQSIFDTQFTLAAWVKGVAQTDAQTIFSQYGHVEIVRNAARNVRVKLTTDTNTYDYTTTNSDFPNNVWTHLAVSYADNVLAIYINGVEKGRFATTGRLSDTYPSNNNLYIGGQYSSTISPTSNRFSNWASNIEYIAVYKIGLRANEIVQLKDGLLTSNNDLFVRPGDRLISTINETNKLVVSKSSASAITENDVYEFVGISREYNIFEFVDSILKKNTLKAFEITKYFGAHPKENPFPQTIAMLFSNFSNLITYHNLPDKSGKAGIAALRVAPFVFEKIASSSRIYSYEKCAEIIHLLRIYDLKFKGVDAYNADPADLLLELVYQILL